MFLKGIFNKSQGIKKQRGSGFPYCWKDFHRRERWERRGVYFKTKGNNKSLHRRERWERRGAM